MRIGKSLALLASLVCSAAVVADTRVELIGRVDFNGLALGNCFVPPCPWTHVRPGEYVHVTFLVNSVGHDGASQWPPCNPPTVIGDTWYDIRNGTMIARAADVPLSIPVGMTPAGISAPGFRMVSDNCTVDQVLIEGAIMGRGGRCCYPNGSCTYVLQANCSGTWSLEGACSPTENTCGQPVGACCAVDNTCTATLAADCVGGTWSYGPCTAGLCPQVIGSCCETSGSCAMTTAAGCEAVWTEGLACDPDTCTAPGLAPDYAMDLTLRGPQSMFSSAVITDNLGYYPPSGWDPNHSWSVIFQSNEMFIYDATAMAFSPDTTAMGSCCPGDGHCLVTSQAICPAQTSWVSGGSCSPNPCPAGSGACCKADGSCELLASAACAALTSAVYQGNSTACNMVTCPPTGACCASGACTLITQSACVAAGGSWLGAGSACAVQPQYSVALSDNVAGKCCYPNGACELKYQTACTGVGYVFTPNQLCDVPCPSAGACCGFYAGECRVVTEAICANVGGSWVGTSTCEGACPDVGVCCNLTAGTCLLVPEVNCRPGDVWTAGGTCAVPCTTGAGACCNTTDGSCRVTTQPFCNGTVKWTAGATCATPCVGATAILPDAVFNGASGVWSNTMTITDPSTIHSLEVWMNLEINRLNDIRVSLTGPNNTTVDLFTRIGAKAPLCQATPIGPGKTALGFYTFQDSAAQSLHEHVLFLGATTATVPGRYRAAGCGGSLVSLNAAFAGIPAAGAWTLHVVDERSGTNAKMSRWGLSFNGGTPAPCTIGKCVVGGNCTATTYAECLGSWSIGPCSPATCTAGTPGACCFLDTCAVMCQSLCPTGAQFAGFGTTCSPSICLVACCKPDGTCSLATSTDCSGVAGTIGSTCSPNTCTQPVACCLSNGECTFGLASACSGGTAGAPGSTCSPNTCTNPNTPPDNDVCSTVLATGPDIVLVNDVWNGSATVLGATADAGFPSCGSGLPAADVWWRFIPPATGMYLISTCGAPVWDSTVSVWNNCNSQVTGGCADDNCSGSNSDVYGHEKLTTQLAGGAPYLIRIGSFSPTTVNAGVFTLSVSALGACCHSNGTCALTSQAGCTGSRQFQGVYSACTPSPCPQPRACCTDQNTCLFMAAWACTGTSTPGPAGSTCSPDNPCGQPAACCHPDGTCEFTYWSLCTGERGQLGSVCDPNSCPQPNGACCAGSSCTVAAQAGCTGPNTVFAGLGTACNAPGNYTTPCCKADYNHLGGVTVQDIFDFLGAYFTQNAYADVNGVGGVTVQDIFDFLSAYFTGC